MRIAPGYSSQQEGSGVNFGFNTHASPVRHLVSLGSQNKMGRENNHLLWKSFTGSDDQARTNSTTDGCLLSTNARVRLRTTPTNHSNMSRLKRTMQLNMVGVVQATLTTLLNLDILTDLPCEGIVRIFIDFGRLLHCGFDAQRFALTRKNARVKGKSNPRCKTRKTGGGGGIKWKAKSRKYTALEKDKQE